MLKSVSLEYKFDIEKKKFYFVSETLMMAQKEFSRLNVNSIVLKKIGFKKKKEVVGGSVNSVKGSKCKLLS